MEKNVLQCVLDFKRRYPGTVMWRVKKHCSIIQKHLNPGEKVLYAFAGQKNNDYLNFFDTAVLCVTSERLLISQDHIIYGYTLKSVTPELYNDLTVFSGLIWGKITIDTVKELIYFSNLTKKSLTEIESVITMFMIEAKKMYPDNNKVSSTSSK